MRVSMVSKRGTTDLESLGVHPATMPDVLSRDG